MDNYNPYNSGNGSNTGETGNTSNTGTGTGKSRTEEFTVNGDDLVGKIKDLMHEGDIRRLIIRGEDGRNLIEIPLTIGVAGAAATVIFAPVLAAIGALAALVTRITIVVERTNELD